MDKIKSFFKKVVKVTAAIAVIAVVGMASYGVAYLSISHQNPEVKLAKSYDSLLNEAKSTGLHQEIGEPKETFFGSNVKIKYSVGTITVPKTEVVQSVDRQYYYWSEHKTLTDEDRALISRLEYARSNDQAKRKKANKVVEETPEPATLETDVE